MGLNDYQPLISVIIPCYCQAKFLPDAVKSIVGQTYTNLEIVIVNDGSPDNTSFVAKKLISIYPDKKIYLLEKENGDVADARNSGIIFSNGDWILPLDSDDMFHPFFLEKAVNLIINDNSLNLITCKMIYFGVDGNNWIPQKYSRENILDNTTFIGTSLFKKKLWVDAGGYNPSLPWGAEDWNFWIDCSKTGINDYCINEELFYYRYHSSGSKVSGVISHHDEIRAMIKTLHPELYPKSSILYSHNIIAKIKPDTFEVINKRIEKFPLLPMPYFWKALYLEEKGHIRESLENYNKSAVLSKDFDWQPFYRLSLIHRELNIPEKAIEYFNELQKRKKNLELYKKTLSISV